MNSYIDQVKEQLKAKLDRFENMAELLKKQEKRLEEKDYSGFDRLCEQVDRIVVELKNIDYETAILEASVESESFLKDSLRDTDLRDLLKNVRGEAERNMEQLNRLAVILAESKIRIRKDLDKTVALGKIGGYRPYEKTLPVYFDKRN